MQIMQVLFSLLLVVFVIRDCRARDRVGSEGGRIVFEDQSGQKIALTQTGLDSDPWLSSDGRSVVFIRHSATDTFRTSVYEVSVQTGTARLLYSGPAKYRGRESSYFGRPELDESRDTLFLLSKEYATEGSLLAVRLVDGQVSLISDHVVGYDIVVCPAKDRGDLIALKRQEDILGSPYYLYWLYSPSGEELGVAGGDELSIDTLRDGGCEEAQPPALAPSLPMGPSASNTILMDGAQMEGRLVRRVEPAYPGQARLEHIQGNVRLQVQVGADGTVQAVNLVSGPPQLVQTAIASVKQWRYLPVLVSGRAVAVVTIVDVPFRIRSADK
jgi:TonB family protein